MIGTKKGKIARNKILAKAVIILGVVFILFQAFTNKNNGMMTPKIIIGMLGLLGISYLIVIRDSDIMKKIFRYKESGKIGILQKILYVFLCLPATVVGCSLLADRINGYTFSRMIVRVFSLKALVNVLIYFTIWLVFFTIVNRMQYAAVCTIMFSAVCNIINYLVWEFRGTPVLFADIFSTKTALEVSSGYEYTLNRNATWMVILALCMIAVLISLDSIIIFSWKKRIIVVLLLIADLAFANKLFFYSTYLREHGMHISLFNPNRNYAEMGNGLSFILSWTYYRVDKPNEYNVKEMESKLEQYKSDEVADGGEKPDMIMIMVEAFADLYYDDPDLELSEDYLPFVHGLHENTIKGRAYVSAEGGGTANSEFEFLTGNTLQFLPDYSIPYNTYIKSPMEALPTHMKELGYSGLNAYHPFSNVGYNRSTVYPLLGFEDFYYKDYYAEKEHNQKVRTLISDEANMDMLIEEYEEFKKEHQEPYFSFNVTIQNHGGYDGSRGSLEEFPVLLTDKRFSNKQLDEGNQYINLAYYSDQAIEKLITYFSMVDKPVMIVIFGDHQPSLSRGFYSTLFGKSVDDFDVKEVADWYSTPYLIWANYDIEEEERDMSLNYLAAYALRTAGCELTGYQKYLLSLMEKLPVITGKVYADSEGNFYEKGKESEYSSLLNEYRCIQYNYLFDRKNLLESFFG